MSPAEHAVESERLLAESADFDQLVDTDDRILLALQGIGHALIALAYESGVPVAAAPAGGGSGG